MPEQYANRNNTATLRHARVVFIASQPGADLSNPQEDQLLRK